MSRAGISALKAPAAKGTAARSRSERPVPGGRLILVMCADMGRVDLVLKAAARRLSKDAFLAEPITTRTLPAGGGMVVTRNGFARLERVGEIVLGWSENGRTYGYGAMLMERLTRGEIVVCPLPAGLQLEAAARVLWHDIKVIRLESGTQSLRAALSPRITLSRMAGRTMARAHLDTLLRDGTDLRIVDHGDLASAVPALTSAIETLIPPALHAPLMASETAPLSLHAAKSATRVPAPRKLREGSVGRRPPADRAVKPQVRPPLTT